jgi:hypothetical protein
MTAGLSTERFSEQYIEACFYAWFRAGRPTLQTRNGAISASGARIMRVLPSTEDGKRPEIHTVNKWMDKYAWIERADALDAQVSVKMDHDVIQKRIKDLKKLADSGEKLLDKALAYLETEENPFEGEPGAAVRALIAASEMIFKYGGAADRLAQIANMTDKQLEAEARRLLGKDSNDENENEDMLEATLEEIPRDDEQFQDDNE